MCLYIFKLCPGGKVDPGLIQSRKNFLIVTHPTPSHTLQNLTTPFKTRSINLTKNTHNSQQLY